MEGVVSTEPTSVAIEIDKGGVEGKDDTTMNYIGAVVGGDAKVDGVVDIAGSDTDADEDNLDEIDIEGIKVEEQKLGNYECPIFVLSKAEEKRIHRPWKRGVIVKLLGRRIGYKALETRLKQMWVKKGIINIIDLGNDYYLVTFSHEFDHGTALMNGPWFIYDHYLTVKEWSPDFHPQSDTIKKVAVWVRISGLPIEYYDARVLKRIGNEIGSTVKVDKNTLMQERGKYARICVEVDLTESLLAMFMIKGRKYNVEYEGLHLLCKNCGKFGHYSEGCPDKRKEVVTTQEGREGGVSKHGGEAMTGSSLDGPWMLVQKQKRNRKGKEKENTLTTTVEGGGKRTPAKINVNGNINGSRFGALMDNNGDELEDNSNQTPILHQVDEQMREEHVAEGRKIDIGVKEQNNEPIIIHKEGGTGKRKYNTTIIANTNQEVANQEVGADFFEKEGIDELSSQLIGTNQEKIIRATKLGARVTGSFKGRPAGKNNGRTNPEHIVENIEENNLANIFKTKFTPMREKKGKDGAPKENSGFNFQDMGLMLSGGPNVPRPPDFMDAPPIINITSNFQQKEDINVEKENFLDASDQVGDGSSDSDMEIVKETPSSELQ
jgi:hypothetical protein